MSTSTTTDTTATAVAIAFYEHISAGDLDAATALVDAGYVGHGLGSDGGPSSVRRDLETWAAAVPDLRIEIEDTVADGELVAIRMQLVGTQSGDFAGIPASDLPFRIGGTDVLRVREGRIVEAWTLCDLASMFAQVGALPATA
ncbi:ester cyclase [Egicoccus sp. AB-alg2]|uniref:ester cyclase n=1 Tax=Egicoccus sp. AB-alg2 TaxID=3242693 RepID=UPI00359DEDDE